MIRMNTSNPPGNEIGVARYLDSTLKAAGIETHLFDVTGDFYGDVVQVGFVARLRDTKRFDSAADLMAQLAADDQGARRALTLLAESAKLKGSMHFPPSTP